MKHKCDKCRGKGGHAVIRGRSLVTIWLACSQCLGKGAWYTNQRPRQQKKTGERVGGLRK